MKLHHSVDPELWNFDSELRLLGLGAGAPISRREALRLGLLGGAGLLLGSAAKVRASAAATVAPVTAAPAPKAKSVIQIWLWGGPCHIDTFDPKPDAGAEYTGQLTQALPTNVAGIRI